MVRQSLALEDSQYVNRYICKHIYLKFGDFLYSNLVCFLNKVFTYPKKIYKHIHLCTNYYPIVIVVLLRIAGQISYISKYTTNSYIHIIYIY